MNFCILCSIVIGDKLPNVAYLTFIDKYILTSYIFLIAVLVESAIVSDEFNGDEDVDLLMFRIFATVYVLMMGIMFIVYAWWLRRKEGMKLVYSSDDVERIVTENRPTLFFDYRHLIRTGNKERILSCMAAGREKWGSMISPADDTQMASLRKQQTKFVQKQHETEIAQSEQFVE